MAVIYPYNGMNIKVGSYPPPPPQDGFAMSSGRRGAPSSALFINKDPDFNFSDSSVSWWYTNDREN